MDDPPAAVYSLVYRMLFKNHEESYMKSYIKDYPRPQLVRKNWTDLNGKWKFAFDDENLGRKKGWNKGFESDIAIEVPFTYETKLSGIGREEAHEHIWYQREIEIDKKDDRRYILHIEGSDYSTCLWVNGEYAGEHKGAYERATFEITGCVKPGKNRIVIAVSDSKSVRQPRGKQRWNDKNFGCWYVQTTGIWKSVWLEDVPDTFIKQIKLTPDVKAHTITIRAELDGTLGSENVLEGEISFEGTVIRSFSASCDADHITMIEDVTDFSESEWGMHLWSPENPEMYDLALTLKKDGAEHDKICSYFGMRDILVEDGQVLINGRPVYQKLILDQGYWKDSHLTAPSEQALIEDIDNIHLLGFNGLRKHMKTEDERFLYWCDVKGMLVWSEMAACYDFDDEALSCFADEWKSVVRQNYNHPCIITWTPFNESWGIHEVSKDKAQQHFTQAIYHLTKSIDLMRPVITNDGWEHTVSDILTLHEYEEEGEVFSKRYLTKKDEILEGSYAHNKANKALADGFEYKGQPVIISEYGGIAFDTSQSDEWGYGNTVSSEDEFVERYRKITEAIMNVPYICGFCYTQVSDVQQEVNGLLTMDRKFKVNPDRIRKINEEFTIFHT